MRLMNDSYDCYRQEIHYCCLLTQLHGSVEYDSPPKESNFTLKSEDHGKQVMSKRLWFLSVAPL